MFVHPVYTLLTSMDCPPDFHERYVAPLLKKRHATCAGCDRPLSFLLALWRPGFIVPDGGFDCAFRDDEAGNVDYYEKFSLRDGSGTTVMKYQICVGWDWDKMTCNFPPLDNGDDDDDDVCQPIRKKNKMMIVD